MAKPGWRAKKRATAAQRTQAALRTPGQGGRLPQEEIGPQTGAHGAVELPWSEMPMAERMAWATGREGKLPAPGTAGQPHFVTGTSAVQPLPQRAAALRVPLSQVLAALSQIHARLQEEVGRVQLPDHPNSAKLFGELAQADQSFAQWYHHLGVALACVAPGQESAK